MFGSIDQVSPQKVEHEFFVRVDPFQETLLKVAWWRVGPHRWATMSKIDQTESVFLLNPIGTTDKNAHMTLIIWHHAFDVDTLSLEVEPEEGMALSLQPPPPPLAPLSYSPPSELEIQDLNISVISPLEQVLSNTIFFSPGLG